VLIKSVFNVLFCRPDPRPAHSNTANVRVEFRLPLADKLPLIFMGRSLSANDYNDLDVKLVRTMLADRLAERPRLVLILSAVDMLFPPASEGRLGCAGNVGHPDILKVANLQAIHQMVAVRAALAFFHHVHKVVSDSLEFNVFFCISAMRWTHLLYPEGEPGITLP
jgi:hypothetical protein